MPNIGATGFILIILVALLLFGPSKLPELGRAFGRTLREFKNGAREIMEDDKEKEAPKAEARRLDEARPLSQSSSSTDKRLPE